MKTYFPLALLFSACLYCSLTAFQCGSAETTSAKLAIEQKQYDKAEESLLKGLAKNDKDEESWFLLGQVRYELKKYPEMNEAFGRALAISVEHKDQISQYRRDVWGKQFNAGVDAYNAGANDPAKYKEAAQHLEMAISMLPDSVTTYRALALAQYAAKDYDKAIATLESALAKSPNYTEAQRLSGQIHYAVADQYKASKKEAEAVASYAKAADMFEKVYYAHPNDPDNITLLIDALTQSNQDEKVLSLTQDCIKKNPNNRVCRFAYGVYLLQQNKYPDAIENLEKARELGPDSTDQIQQDATYNLGVGYLNWGVAMKAEADKKAEAESKGKKGSDVKANVAYKEKFKAALPYLEESALVRKDDANLWQRMGQVYAVLNMVEKSKNAFDQYDRLTKEQ
jgi:tetratricopeptide (TPR) repeat protein